MIPLASQILIHYSVQMHKFTIGPSTTTLMFEFFCPIRKNWHTLIIKKKKSYIFMVSSHPHTSSSTYYAPKNITFIIFHSKSFYLFHLYIHKIWLFITISLHITYYPYLFLQGYLKFLQKEIKETTFKHKHNHKDMIRKIV